MTVNCHIDYKAMYFTGNLTDIKMGITVHLINIVWKGMHQQASMILVFWVFISGI